MRRVLPRSGEEREREEDKKTKRERLAVVYRLLMFRICCEIPLQISRHKNPDTTFLSCKFQTKMTTIFFTKQKRVMPEKEESIKHPYTTSSCLISLLSFLPSLLPSLLLSFNPLHRSIALSPTPQPMRLAASQSPVHIPADFL